MFTRCLLAAAAFLAGATHATGAEFRIERLSDGTRAIFMRGQVQTGDLDRLKQVGAGLRLDDKDSETDDAILLLSGPGGDMREGLRIARFVYQNGIGTFVGSSSECYSACAVIFMHGTRRYLERSKDVRRTMSVTAKVGFHAPFAPYATDPVMVQELQREMVAALIDSADQRQFPRSLISEMYKRGPQDVFLLDTIDMAGRWNVALGPVRYQPTLTKQMARDACWNKVNWDADFFAARDSADRSFFIDNNMPAEKRIAGRQVFTTLIGEELQNECNVVYAVQADRRIATVTIEGRSTIRVPWFSLLPARTNFSDIPEMTKLWLSGPQ